MKAGERTREAESRTAEKLKNFVFTRSQRGSDGFQKFLKISKAKVMENLTPLGQFCDFATSSNDNFYELFWWSPEA